MKGGIKIGVKVKGVPEFAISCGDAKQTVRWLASAIQARLKSFNLMRKSLETDHYIVIEIRNNSGELINPNDKIYEHMEENNKLTVEAVLATTFPVDDWENPAMNDWMQAAYLHSEPTQHWAREVEAWRYSLEQVKLSQNGNEVDNNIAVMAQKVIPQSSQLIKIGFDFTKKDLELAFNLDWKVMRWPWIALNEVQKNAIGDTLKTNYSLICNIFAHYAGIGKVGLRYGMTIEEFGHLLHYMNIMDWKTSEESVESIFRSTAGDSELRSDRPDEQWPLMTRSHLVEALCYLAVDKYEDKVEDAIKKFIEGPVNSFWDIITSKYMCYTCPDPALKQAFLDYHHIVKMTFQQRSYKDSKFGVGLAATDFVEMMRESSLVDAEQESICIAGFLQAQLNPSVQRELEYLVYVEFIEALSRVAMKSMESVTGLTDAKRIRMGFNLITELPQKDYK